MLEINDHSNEQAWWRLNDRLGRNSNRHLRSIWQCACSAYFKTHACTQRNRNQNRSLQWNIIHQNLTQRCIKNMKKWISQQWLSLWCKEWEKQSRTDSIFTPGGDIVLGVCEIAFFPSGWGQQRLWQQQESIISYHGTYCGGVTNLWCRPYLVWLGKIKTQIRKSHWLSEQMATKYNPEEAHRWLCVYGSRGGTWKSRCEEDVWGGRYQLNNREINDHKFYYHAM